MIETLATGFAAPRAIVVSRRALWVADTADGLVVRLELGSRATVADIEAPLRLIMVGESLLALSFAEEGSLFAIGTSGAQLLAEGLTFATDVCVRTEEAWISCLGEDRDGGSLKSLPLRGGPVVTRFAGLRAPMGLACRGRQVAFINSAGQVWQTDNDGQTPVLLYRPGEEFEEQASACAPPALPSRPLTLSTSPPTIRALAEQDGSLGWIGVDGKLRRWQPGAVVPPPTGLATLGSAPVVGARGCFFAVESLLDRIVAAPARPEAPVIELVTHEPGILAVAASRERVYWATDAAHGGMVRSLALADTRAGSLLSSG
jgi:hypothetical protein